MEGGGAAAAMPPRPEFKEDAENADPNAEAAAAATPSLSVREGQISKWGIGDSIYVLK